MNPRFCFEKLINFRSNLVSFGLLGHLFMRYFVIVFVILLFEGCSDKKAKNEELLTIDVSDAFRQMKNVSLSKFITSISYIPLESNANSLISEYPTIKVEDFIIIRNLSSSQTPLLLYEKKTGKFIREIGKLGKGPGEYSVAVSDFYNSDKKLVYTMDYTHRFIKILNVRSEYLDGFRMPEIIEPSLMGGVYRLRFGTFLNDSVYVSYTTNENGEMSSKIVLFTGNRIIKIFPNFLKWGNGDPNKTKNGTIGGPIFFRWNKNLFFKETFNDTLFQIKLSSLIPRIVFNYGKYGLQYEQQDRMQKSDGQLNFNYFIITDIDENLNYIFFQLSYMKKSYTCFYDKTKKATTICAPINGTLSGLIDDINGFMPIVPKGFTQSNELIAVLDPLEISRWLVSNPWKKEHLFQKFPWLKNINELSNPVLVVAQCKF